MIDENKVICMTKLAIMEKNNVKKDLKITSYFEEDYVYMNNLKTRISILILMSIGIGGHLLWRVEKGLNMPTNRQDVVFDYLVPYGSYIILGLVLYTMISTFVYRRRYRGAEKRVKEYTRMLKEFNEQEENKIKEVKHHAYRGRAFEKEAKDTTIL